MMMYKKLARAVFKMNTTREMVKTTTKTLNSMVNRSDELVDSNMLTLVDDLKDFIKRFKEAKEELNLVLDDLQLRGQNYEVNFSYADADHQDLYFTLQDKFKNSVRIEIKPCFINDFDAKCINLMGEFPSTLSVRFLEHLKSEMEE